MEKKNVTKSKFTKSARVQCWACVVAKKLEFFCDACAKDFVEDEEIVIAMSDMNIIHLYCESCWEKMT